MKKIITLLLISVFAGCAAYKPITPLQGDAVRASQKFPGTTLADLQEGRSIFESSCSKCHSLKKPFKKSEEIVRSAMPRMAKRAKLDSKQEDLVLKYLVTMKSGQG